MQAPQSSHARQTTIAPLVPLTTAVVAMVLGTACGGPPPASESLAAPPVAAKPMPPIPDLSRWRTFTRPIPGLPTDKAGLTNAALQQLGDLKYPNTAWNQGLQGWAVYDFVVAADGKVDPKYVRLVRASDDVFAKPAEEAVRAARFTPATKRGTAVPTLVRLPVYFSLDQASRPR
ncbi:MAG: energy transducer TonB [Gemmatimonadota bacterium]|nr:energy transducer TonB [Gemmatimonadota bacterium]